MALFSSAVTVTACIVSRHGQDTEYPEPEVFHAFDHLFRPAVVASASHSSEGRAQKRRRLPNGAHASAPRRSDEPSAGGKSVLLAKTTLHLERSDSQTTLPPAPDDSHRSVELSLEAFSRRDAQQISLSLFESASSTNIEFVATAAPDQLQPLVPHLETAASVATTLRGRKRTSIARVPFCRCVLSPPTAEQQSLQLHVELRWLLGIAAMETVKSREIQRADARILSTYLPDSSIQAEAPFSLSDFYDAVYVPPKDDVSDRIKESLTQSTLLPYQRRTVNWMLLREGVAFSPNGELQAMESSASDDLPVSFTRTQDASGNACSVSHLRGMVISGSNKNWDSSQSTGFGILAEEMGLGKTVEMIALMCLNKRRITKEDVHDPYLGKSVKASSATLIIAPPALIDQWISEVNKHAPQLKVFHYKGVPSHTTPKQEHGKATIEHLSQFDVVLTSYQVLAKELHHATPPPDRSFRHKKIHQRRNSPLVEISWWRVCLDEAQMVESGVSQAAKVARIIPRCNAWAVSGTPLRKDVQDLLGLLVFLRYEPFATTKNLFSRLTKSSFRAIFNRICVRHTKDQIRDELRIPPQKRVVITVPFSLIEEEYYTDMFRQMCEACFLSPEGAPLREDRGVDHPETIERMREWLVRLRQTCLHSHIGQKNKKIVGSKKGPLRSIQEVLEGMIDHNDTSLKAEARELISCQMKRGHIFSNAKNFENRNEVALPMYREARNSAQEYVKLCREEILAEKKRLGVIGHGHVEDHEEDEGEDEENTKNSRIITLRRSLRTFLELEHACEFYMGNMYFQWKENIALTEPDSAGFHKLEKHETEHYNKAQLIRRELLKDSKARAQRLMRRIKESTDPHRALEVRRVPDLGGIESSKVLEQLATIGRVINGQNSKLEEWRNRIINILTMSLVDEEGEKEGTGHEYDLSTRMQDELYVYIMALRTIIADRATAMDGTRDLLVDHELQQAVRQAHDKDPMKRGHAPHLVIEVAQDRERLKPKPQDGSLKGVIAEARATVTSLQYRASTADGRAAAELAIAEKYLAQVQAIYAAQTMLLADLEKEQELFRLTMNQRLEFYRQLQHISDTVVDWKDTMDAVFDGPEDRRQTMLVRASKEKLIGLKVKQTFLLHLRSEDADPNYRQDCGICLEKYEIGSLNVCGHKYCKVCMEAWWKSHHSCPMCRITLTRADMKEISFKKSTVKAHEEDEDAATETQASSPSSESISIYSDMRDSTMNEIKTIKLNGSYGSKVDMIARHLLWIRHNDPGAKSIIYSQFTDFLEVLRSTLAKSKVGVTGIRDKNGIENFRTSPAVDCFLLDAKSNSSGLNLVNATYVFLCEPLINPALELQAIARVHRIGQERATTVFMYLIENTVEQAIYDISVKRRLEHMGRNEASRTGSSRAMLEERTLDAANSEEIENAKLSKLVRTGNNGEVVVEDDLWKCLFTKPRGLAHLDERVITDRQRRMQEGVEYRIQQLEQQVADVAVAVEDGNEVGVDAADGVVGADGTVATLRG